MTKIKALLQPNDFCGNKQEKEVYILQFIGCGHCEEAIYMDKEGRLGASPIRYLTIIEEENND